MSETSQPWEWAVDSPVWLKPRRTLYFLIRRSDSHGAMEYRRDKLGRLITYRTCEQAIRIQDRLNAKEQSLTTATTKATLLLTLVLFLAPGVGAQRGTQITEDDPRWNCRTMGNRTCGPSRILIVSRHRDHFDAVRSDGVRLVEFETLGEVRAYAMRYGYAIVIRSGRKGQR